MNSPKEGAHVMSVPVVLCKGKDAVLRLWAIITLGLAHSWLYRPVLKGTTDLLPQTHQKSMAVQHMGQYCTSHCPAGLWTFVPRHHPFVPVKWEFSVAKFPFPLQAVHTLFKASGVSPPREYCIFYRLISAGWVHLLGALGYFSSPSVIPAYFSLDSIHSPCCLQQPICADGKFIFHSLHSCCIWAGVITQA